MTRKPIILDTDIGTDVDDLLALSLVLTSPELELVGVTTVYGDVALRAHMVRRLLALRGVTGIPLAMGASKPLLGKRAIYWEGHEGKGLLTPEEEAAPLPDEHAVDMIVRTVMARPGEITLAAIGPLTNIALAFLREPRLAQALAGLLIMGGSVGGARALHLPWTEHNFRCDPEAAHVVLSAGAPTWIVPLDVTTQVRIRQADVERTSQPGRSVPSGRRRSGGELSRLREARLDAPARSAGGGDGNRLDAGDLAARAGGHRDGRRAHGRALLVAPPPADGPATAQVALDVDIERAERFIVDRLAN